MLRKKPTINSKAKKRSTYKKKISCCNLAKRNIYDVKKKLTKSLQAEKKTSHKGKRVKKAYIIVETYIL